MLKGRPTKISDVSTAKTGKHGAAKCMFVGVDIFNDRKIEETYGSGDNMDVPNLGRKEYQLIDIDDDGIVSMMDPDSGDMKEDLNLPSGTDRCDSLAKDIQAAWEEGKGDIMVTVIAACGEEQIYGFKITNAN